MNRLSALRRKVAEAERRAEGKPKGSRTHVTLARARAELQDAELRALRALRAHDEAQYREAVHGRPGDPETRRSGGAK